MEIGAKFAIGATAVVLLGIVIARSSDSSGQASADPSFAVGATVTLQDHAIECRDVDHLERLLTLAKDEGDREAAMRYMLNPLNECRMAAQNSTGAVEDVSPLHSAVKVRERGDPDAWWVNDGNIVR